MFPFAANPAAPLVTFTAGVAFSGTDPAAFGRYLHAVGEAQRPWFPSGVVPTGRSWPLLSLTQESITQMGCYVEERHGLAPVVMDRVGQMLARVMYAPTYVLLRGGMRKMALAVTDVPGTAGITAPRSAPVEVAQYGPPSRQVLTVCSTLLLGSDPRVLEFVIAHELMHWLRSDVFHVGKLHRDGEIGGLPLDARILNIALDCIVNASLVEMGLEFPDVGIMHEDISWKTSFADAYRIVYQLVSSAGDDPGADDSEGDDPEGDDSGAGGPEGDDPGAGDPFGLGRELTPNPPGDPATTAQEHLAENDIRSAIDEAKQAGYERSRLIDHILDEGARPVDLAINMRVIVDEMTRGFDQEGEEPSVDTIAEWWAASDQGTRHAPVEPGLVGSRFLPLAVILDTSGSMSAPEMGRVFDVLRAAKDRGMTVVLLDTDVEVENVRIIDDSTAPSKLAVAGRGGTDLRTGFDLIARAALGEDESVYTEWPALLPLRDGLTAVVVVSDMITPWPDRWDISEVVALATSGNCRTPSWMRIVR